MIQWKYCDEIIPRDFGRHEQLAELGDRGWEAYSVLPVNSLYEKYFFKKPKEVVQQKEIPLRVETSDNSKLNRGTDFCDVQP